MKKFIISMIIFCVIGFSIGPFIHENWFAREYTIQEINVDNLIQEVKVNSNVSTIVKTFDEIKQIPYVKGYNVDIENPKWKTDALERPIERISFEFEHDSYIHASINLYKTDKINSIYNYEYTYYVDKCGISKEGTFGDHQYFLTKIKRLRGSEYLRGLTDKYMSYGVIRINNIIIELYEQGHDNKTIQKDELIKLLIPVINKLSIIAQ